MREGHRANALLIELLLVIFFFMLGAMILVQVLADARSKSIQASKTNLALVEAQNLAEDIYASGNPAGMLEQNGFTAADGTWRIEKDGYIMTVHDESEDTETGVLRTYRINVEANGKQLLSLPSTRFIPGEVKP